MPTFPWRDQLEGFHQGGVGVMLDDLEQQGQEQEEEINANRTRDLSEDRTRNVLGVRRSGDKLTPSQVELAAAFGRFMESGEVGPVNGLEKTGGFSLDSSGRYPNRFRRRR